MSHGLCDASELGQFLLDTSKGPTLTIQQKQFDFGAGSTAPATFTYPVNMTGYYCIVATSLTRATPSTSATGQFRGHAEFHNVFKGNLPASEHPKKAFYGVLAILYMAFGAVWIALCVMHRDQIVKVQHFITGTILFLVFDMVCQWLFYVYYDMYKIDFANYRAVNGSASVTSTARFLLAFTSILDAARDSASFFLLLIVAMGYGVVRPTIGSVLRKVQLLTAMHFVFGVLYSVGIVLILLEMDGGWVFLFIFPLAATLTMFLVWTLQSLKSTIMYLTSRRQTYKCSMFQRLYYILLGAAIGILAFFFVALFLVASNETGELAVTSWEYRWFLLDGSMGILYFLGTSALLTSLCLHRLRLATDRPKHAVGHVGRAGYR